MSPIRKQPDDEFASLPISPQAKWARRNRDKVNAMKRKRYQEMKLDESIKKIKRKGVKR